MPIALSGTDSAGFASQLLAVTLSVQNARVSGSGGSFFVLAGRADAGEFADGSGGVCEPEHGVVAEGGSVVAVAHEPLCELRSHTGACQLGSEGRPEGVQIDHTAFVVLNTDPSLGATSAAAADQDGFTIGITDRDPACETGTQEVVEPGAIGDQSRPDSGGWDGWVLSKPFCECVGQLRVHREDVGAFGFAVPEDDPAFLEYTPDHVSRSLHQCGLTGTFI